ncbi:TonB-dependent receptor family protein [Thiohalobacter thiocyanaticus]|uniref:TonB-dependent receptor n=1 Tax=Thiohalobacter thiocyanaticus TaxID=585455 RepID=A0A426QJY0_9GAMM|nr:TonB-dependent receptor [Thiohalobacter thiocyanaticus]RRQ22058.1 TonB-dependent receptor [Thiohalobacter thiocyanaticus]
MHRLLLPGILALAAPATAQEQPPAPDEPITITITAPRLTRDLQRTPAAVTVVEQQDLRQARQGLGLDTALNRTPGVLFRNRYNFAQNLRLSIRGFGARAPFGIRGVRILIDGFPETLPDGQSQIDSIDLESIDRVELIRGPSSALYGNAAGGVLQIHTADPPATPFAELQARAGSHDFRKLTVRGGGRRAAWGAQVSASRLDYDGYRRQSRTRKDLLNTKLTYDIDALRSIEAVLTALDQPYGEDPGGLTRSEVETDRRQAAPNALALDSGQSVRQRRLGIRYRDRNLGSGEFSARLFHTRRDFEQQLPFPGPSRLQYERDFFGAGLDYTANTRLGKRPLRYTLGLEAARQRDDRQRFEVDNDGRLTGQIQDALETATEAGLYGQADLALSERMDLTLGGRYDRVEFDIDDRLTPDGAASGSRTFDELSFTLGLGYQLQRDHRLYAAAGSAFETPSFTEFSDPTEPGEGFDPDLDPQQALNLELGAKGFIGKDLRYELALFRVETRDEIVQVASEPDRFANAARTRRTGLEATLIHDITDRLRLTSAYTHARYRFRQFVDAAGTDLAGRRLPGLPEQTLFTELAWRDPSGPYVILDGLAVGRVYADNANREPVAGYAVVNLRAGIRGAWQGTELEVFAGLNNLTDRDYFSNVRINAAAGRFFEPAPERNVHAGVRLRY